jgi:hypothetical protein
LLGSARAIPDEETPEQFRCVLRLLEHVTVVSVQSLNGPCRGRTDKLVAL